MIMNWRRHNVSPSSDDEGPQELLQHAEEEFAPYRAVSHTTHATVWRKIEVKAMTPSRGAVPATRRWQAASAARSRISLRWAALCGGALVALLLVLLAGPLIQARSEAHGVLNSAEAATLPAPSGQVLHCTMTTTYTPASTPTRDLGQRDIWLDAERGFARIDNRIPTGESGNATGISRQVFSGGTSASYSSRTGNVVVREGVTLSQFMSHQDCSLNDHLREVRAAIFQIDPRRSTTIEDGSLDGIPVQILSLHIDARETGAYYLGLPAEPGKTTTGLPVHYTFRRDTHLLVRIQGWALTDHDQGVAPVEMRMSYDLAPADTYPATFFSAAAITPQP